MGSIGLAGAWSVPEQIRPESIVVGDVFDEPVRVLMTKAIGDSLKIVGAGVRTGQVHDRTLTPEQVALLVVSPEKEPFDGTPDRFKLGVEALRLGLAYEYDPYFSLSISRVEPLPHQLEAVYDYFLKLPRIRFLLADDPGAGKTIMAGLLIKELKIRGLIKRTLIVTPASLSFQWQREMREKFREQFEIIRGDVLRANYGMNPWQEKNQVITSLPWVAHIEDARESLLRSQWDLIIVDEAHKMSAASSDKKTLAYELGEHLGEMTDHYLLMTATPHKGDPKHFCLFLELLDKEVYGDVSSLEEAVKRHDAPFYLRRVKEALVTFPDPDTGISKALFTRRNVSTSEFQISDIELEFYDALTTYVENESEKAGKDDSARGRAVGFTMAMLQRRFASSVYAVRRSLERMKARREKILADPDGYRADQMAKRLPDDFEDLSDEEREKIIADLEDVVVSVDPAALQAEIIQLGKLVVRAMEVEQLEVESKLKKLKEVIQEAGVFSDPKMKLLLFTEHKDTLDFLAGDGRDGRPLGKLREWNLSVTQIHGSMKVGDRDTPGTRLHAEREFREDAQVLVATEAAGEGINLQFCWFMVNYDIPWNPMRLEQRMGRIHRYGQEKDCLIVNFVTTNTREGRVLSKLFERIRAIEDDLDPARTGKVFNVLGEVLPASELEGMLRGMYARNLTEQVIKDRIVERVDSERIRRITDSALEGLAKHELNLSAIIGKRVEAKERRLVPEVIESFFVAGAPAADLPVKEAVKGRHIYGVSGMPRHLKRIGETFEPRFGRLSSEGYKRFVFDRELLTDDPTLEWVTPGHPLFECVREDVQDKTRNDIRRGALFYDLHREAPARLDLFSAAIRDGRNRVLHKRLFVVEATMDGALSIRQPTIFLDLSVPEPSEAASAPDEPPRMPDISQVEAYLHDTELAQFRNGIASERGKEIETVRKHVDISLHALINRQQLRFAELTEESQSSDPGQLNAANLKTVEERLQKLNDRHRDRIEELDKERHCMISDVQHIGRAWVLPHPERRSPQFASMVRDEDIERIAVQAVIAHEEARGWVVESVEADNRGFDLISRKPHPEDTQTAIEVRFIEVKGRAAVGEVAVTSNEFDTAGRLKEDYWLYVVYNCGATPEIHVIQNPARLGWKPIVRVEHYVITAPAILQGEA